MLLGVVAGIGLLDELIQGYLPQRVFQWSDVALNWAGGLVGAILWRAMAHARSLR
jgi:VanZ family protein